MAVERNGIREYSRIRPFLTYIYLYGFLSRDDFASLGISGPDEYDYCTKLLRNIMPNMNDDAYWNDRKKHLRFSREYSVSSELGLADSYLLHTIKDHESGELLNMLSCVAKSGATQSQLEYAFSEVNGDVQTDKASTINRRRKELQECGYISKQKKVYRLKKSPLNSLPADELYALYDYVCFCAETTYPRVAGSFVRRYLRREFLCRGLAVPEGTPFLLRHNGCSNVFDEDIVYRLKQAIRKRCYAVICFPKGIQTVIPVALRVDCRLGRWYLLYWNAKPCIARIQNIQSCKIGEKVKDELWNNVFCATQNAFSNSGCARFMSAQEPYEVVAELLFDEASGIKNQFIREIRMGEIIRHDGKDYYRVVVNDPVELVPLLRQYAPWIRILPGNHDLDARIHQDLLRMRQQLEEQYDGTLS